MFSLTIDRFLSGQAEPIINRSISEVYDVVENNYFTNYSKWCAEIIELDEISIGPIHSGNRGIQTTRNRGLDRYATFEVGEFDQNKNLEIKGVSDSFWSICDFSKNGIDGTQLSYKFELGDLDLSMLTFRSILNDAINDGAEETVVNIKT
jgi:hypothetical protein